MTKYFLTLLMTAIFLSSPAFAVLPPDVIENRRENATLKLIVSVPEAPKGSIGGVVARILKDSRPQQVPPIAIGTKIQIPLSCHQGADAPPDGPAYSCDEIQRVRRIKIWADAMLVSYMPNGSIFIVPLDQEIIE